MPGTMVRSPSGRMAPISDAEQTTPSSCDAQRMVEVTNVESEDETIPCVAHDTSVSCRRMAPMSSRTAATPWW